MSKPAEDMTLTVSAIFIAFILFLLQVNGCAISLKLDTIIKRLPEPPTEKAK